MTEDRMLVALDGSRPAQSAAMIGLWLARAMNLSVQALYIVEAAEVEDPYAERGPEMTAGRSVRSPGEAVVVTADAAMPHHGHGMNFVPRTTALGEGRYRIEGMLFHMRGRWELFVDVEHDGLLERAQWTLEAE